MVDFLPKTVSITTKFDCCRCRKKCFSRTNENERIQIFSKFWDIDSKNAQDIYLQSLIAKVDVGRRTKKPVIDESEDDLVPTARQRTVTFRYFMNVDSDTSLEVCKHSFCSIFGISPERVRRLCNLLKENKLPTDLRGKAPAKNAIPAETCTLIENHIKSFPQKISHYSNKEVRNYLDAQLSVKKMFDMFKEKHPNAKVNYWFYHKIFKERFNLRFGRPQVDTCITCESLSVKMKYPVLNDAAKRAAIAELIVHKRRSKKFYDMLKECKEKSLKDPTKACICFDYMMVVPLPKIPVQDIFYLRQLSVNIFCVTNVKTGHSKLYIYHEGVCKKSPNEVVSFIDDYIKTELNDKNIEELSLFADNCGGQNKNHALVRYCMALVETGKFKKVDQYYPLRGHSFLPCDRAFGTIKRAMKKLDRIYTLKQVVEIIANSSSKFTVHIVESADVLNFHDWWPKYYKRSCLSDDSYGKDVKKSDKVRFMISKVHHFSHQTKGKVECKDFIGSLTPSRSFTLRLPEKSCETLLEFPKEVAYNAKLGINIKKMNDLKSIINYIPQEYTDFFLEIYQWPTTTAESDETCIVPTETDD